MKTVDRLLETQCFIIDFLPEQVPEESGEQFFRIENYLLNNYERLGIKDRIIRIILKAMCYYPVSVFCGKWINQPSPEQVVEIIDTIMDHHSGDMNMIFTSKDVLLQFLGDCLNISIYNPDEEMCKRFEKIATSEGMFWREAE